MKKIRIVVILGDICLYDESAARDSENEDDSLGSGLNFFNVPENHGDGKNTSKEDTDIGANVSIGTNNDNKNKENEKDKAQGKQRKRKAKAKAKGKGKKTSKKKEIVQVYDSPLDQKVVEIIKRFTNNGIFNTDKYLECKEVEQIDAAVRPITFSESNNNNNNIIPRAATESHPNKDNTVWKIANRDIKLEHLIGHDIVIVGESRSGKTSLLKKFALDNPDKFDFRSPTQFQWYKHKSILSHFCNAFLGMAIMGNIGLNSVPTWVKPFHVLSRGEKYIVVVLQDH